MDGLSVYSSPGYSAYIPSGCTSQCEFQISLDISISCELARVSKPPPQTCPPLSQGQGRVAERLNKLTA